MANFQPCRFCGSPRESRRCNFCARATTQRARAKTYKVENTLTANEIYSLYLTSKGICYYCQKPIEGNWTLDHLVAMYKGGGNILSNVVIACMPCNRSKGAFKAATYYKLTKKMSQKKAFRTVIEQTLASMNGDWFSAHQFEIAAGSLFRGRPMDIQNFEFFLRIWIGKTEFERKAVHNPENYNFECLYRVKTPDRKTELPLINAIKPLIPFPTKKRSK